MVAPRPVLMSFQPQWADSILRHGTPWELRRTRCGCAEGTPVLVYSSGKQRQVAGTFRAGRVLAGHPYDLYDQVGESCGVDLDGFFDYLYGLETGYAIEVCEPRLVDPFSLPFRAPMSFRYLDAADPEHATVLSAAGL